MFNFFKKLLFLGETILGVVIFVMIFSPVPYTLPWNVIMGCIGLFLIFDGLERLDGPEHGPY